MDDFDTESDKIRCFIDIVGKALDDREENRRLIQGAENGSLKKLNWIQQTRKSSESFIERSMTSFCRQILEKSVSLEMKERTREENLEVIQQAIASLERKETLRKYNSLTVKEKPAVDWIDNEQESDPPYFKERYSMSTTPGFKFQPNDEEIIRHLENKPSNPCQTPSSSPIKDCPGFYGTQPRHLPDTNGIKEKKALYYYVRTKKRSGNSNRTGSSEYWRASGNKNILSETG